METLGAAPTIKHPVRDSPYKVSAIQKSAMNKGGTAVGDEERRPQSDDCDRIVILRSEV